jgi:uncharacterized coiled-coil protein SlyX
MAEAAPEPVNAGEQVGAPPTGLGVTSEAQYRMLAARLEEVATEVGKLAKPAAFRVSDMLELGAIAIGIAVALISAFSLNERISELSRQQAAAEQRIDGSVMATEQRVTSRLDKLSDQFTQLDERTSKVEGEKASGH